MTATIQKEPQLTLAITKIKVDKTPGGLQGGTLSTTFHPYCNDQPLRKVLKGDERHHKWRNAMETFACILSDVQKYNYRSLSLIGRTVE